LIKPLYHDSHLSSISIIQLATKKYRNFTLNSLQYKFAIFNEKRGFTECTRYKVDLKVLGSRAKIKFSVFLADPCTIFAATLRTLSLGLLF